MARYEEAPFYPVEGVGVLRSESPRRKGLVNRVTAMLQAFRADADMPEDLVVPDGSEVLSRMGMRRVEQGSIVQFMNISPSYSQAVRDSRRLDESSPVFTAIFNKLTRTIAEAPTRVEFSGSPRSKEASEVIAKFLSRVQLEEKKALLIRNMLREGGLSMEVVLSSVSQRIDRLEPRPHDSIKPIVNSQGAFLDSAHAYEQIDPMGQPVAKFALWQIIDVNLEESSFHDRGVPHMQSARQLMEYVSVMSKGLMQKWVRESGSIEHFNMEDARKWEDVEEFQARNQDTLNASPDNLIRQFFTRGKVKIERVVADARTHQTNSIEFMLELIFLCAGVSKEIMGFKSHVVVRDMIDLQIDNYYQTLSKIQSRFFAGLRKAIDLELLLHGMLPEDLPYRVIGGRFDVTRQVRIDKFAIDVGAVSLNDIRRASNLPPNSNPLWDQPGLYNDPATARRLAELSGVELPSAAMGDFPPKNGQQKPGGAAPTATKQPVGRPTKPGKRLGVQNRQSRVRADALLGPVPPRG